MASNQASPQTMRRLMKEFYSVRSELEARRRRSMHGSAEQQHYKPSANLHPRRSRQRGEILAFAQGAEQPQRSSGSSSIEGEAHPDLLELRPRDADQGDLFEWYAVIKGPDEGNYEGGIFELTITVPFTYPSKPPAIRFKTKVWHPNISWKTGEVCLDVLSSQWSPAWQLASACTAILALLDSPEPDSPLNVDAAAVFRAGDVTAYRSMCQMHTLLHAADTHRIGHQSVTLGH